MTKRKTEPPPLGDRIDDLSDEAEQLRGEIRLLREAVDKVASELTWIIDNRLRHTPEPVDDLLS